MSVSGSLGAPKIKISAAELSIVRSGSLHIPCNQRSLVKQRPMKYLSLRTSLGSVKAVQVSTVPAEEASGMLISLYVFSSLIDANFSSFTIYMLCTLSVFIGGLICHMCMESVFYFSLNVFCLFFLSIAPVEVEESEEIKSYPLNTRLVPKPSEVGSFSSKL